MADGTELVKKLNDEGDLEADYIEELLNMADLDGDIEIGVGADHVSVAIVTEDVANHRLKRLIGQGGEVLGTLQELTRLAIQAKTGECSRLVLNIVDYRKSHCQEVAAIAHGAVASVLASREPASLAPMNPFERKIVRDVAATAGLTSGSEGLGNVHHAIVSEAAAANESLEEGGSSEEGTVSDSALSGSNDVVSAGVAGDASVDIAGESTDPIDGENAGKSSASSAAK